MEQTSFMIRSPTRGQLLSAVPARGTLRRALRPHSSPVLAKRRWVFSQPRRFPRTLARLSDFAPDARVRTLVEKSTVAVRGQTPRTPDSLPLPIRRTVIAIQDRPRRPSAAAHVS